MITEHLKELREVKRYYEFRHRQRLGLKPVSRATKYIEGTATHGMFAALHRGAMKTWRAGLRDLNRRIAALDYAITILERTMEARVLLRSKANVRAVDSITNRYCSGCGELAPCQSDCPAGTYTIKLRK